MAGGALALTLVLAACAVGFAGPAGAASRGTLSGVVTDSLTGDPIAGATVYAYGGVYAALYGQATTAADGTYTLSLPQGSFRVPVVAAGYNRMFSGPSTTSSGSSGVWVAADSTTTYDVAMNSIAKRAILRGTVTGDHLPVGGVEVRAYGVYGVRYGFTTTAPDGTWSMNLPAGSFHLRFDDPSGTYPRVYSVDSATWLGSTAVWVAPYLTTVFDISMPGPVGADCTAAIDGMDVDLSGRDFSGKDLSNCDLSNATLLAARFSGANLRGADLSNAFMPYDFTNADATGANFSHALFAAWNCEDSGWVLYASVFDGTVMEGANLQGATLTSDQLNAVIGSPVGDSYLAEFPGWESCMPYDYYG